MRCWSWFHKWEIEEPYFQFIATATEIRRCVKCGKREKLGYYWGELWSKEEIRLMTLTETCGCGASFKVEDYARVDIPAREAAFWWEEHMKYCTYYKTQIYPTRIMIPPEMTKADFEAHFTPENMEDRS
jgi:hypothetical protein